MGFDIVTLNYAETLNLKKNDYNAEQHASVKDGHNP